eukprot:GHVS01033097.1.p2 GENE.GHVS01033097.1~~GHVS01033097.1.p2  ORF type:complete len:100 (+),score=10.34 GHVS01033097.1:948-1247(+)
MTNQYQCFFLCAARKHDMSRPIGYTHNDMQRRAVLMMVSILRTSKDGIAIELFSSPTLSPHRCIHGSLFLHRPSSSALTAREPFSTPATDPLVEMAAHL